MNMLVRFIARTAAPFTVERLWGKTIKILLENLSEAVMTGAEQPHSVIQTRHIGTKILAIEQNVDQNFLSEP